ncbi:type I restriction endonuclease subunit R [Brevibacillus laterosporus]|uniref:type I restriction endonuclease subunit R n=1 Tax=Brevibacillus laterosporus TaxID=1465 RepID=UPI00215BFF25|nr:HsdR family type I site-specific deoxyribonuclease [Brevibacillus laterosporus]MCR8996516.1 HsdR family type I site-specific deoxyribonuclease [Brevibacillus laterosporus]
MVYKNEKEFEVALVNLLVSQKGWDGIIENPTEEDLLHNWANILFENNKELDRLNNVPLNKGEMNQIIEQINALKTPLMKNLFINGKSVTIKRENEADKLHFGKEVSLKIYDRREIAAGSSYYQIARQPRFSKKSSMLSDRRGDVMLLINGMPVIHVELKRSGVPVSKAINQIEKYSHENVFLGIFSLIQVFVAMNPDETLYFANPGEEGKFNPDYYFHWADFDNEPINNWKDIADTLLSIPMAHQLIGYYTVPDSTDNVLKVMRSYQYYAANEISDRVAQMNWRGKDARGGYVWHTTGSGKTMTSFKSAQLIASSGDADKVVFLMDRIELGTQSLSEFQGFADNKDDVQGTESTGVLITKLKSDLSSDTLIVTSIQKMSNIKEDGAKQSDIETIQSKRIVFIVDEAHRSTFGEMLITIKKTFPDAIFFGFTGTPIQVENEIKSSTTAMVFGNELHRYSISDGIRDENVLAFDLYKVPTFSDNDIRKQVALSKAKAIDEQEVMNDPKKSEVYYKFMDSKQVPMVGYFNSSNKYVRGIEDDIPKSQFEASHREKVVEDILNNWITLSRNSKFHAILATSSIREAIEYYRLLKENQIGLKVTALFDNNFDNPENVIFMEEGLVEILIDYNNQFNQDFTIPKHAKFRKDVALRLAHKTPYTNLKKDKQLDIVIVVNQLLTGFDSKWINTLYLDKVMEYANIIQAFSRTNRLFGKREKPFGIIRYYRLVNTMERNIEDAVKAYSGDKELGLFVDKLGRNLTKLNQLFDDISAVFSEAGIDNFEKLPDDNTAKGKFANLFRTFNDYLEAAKIQGFSWEKLKYDCVIETGELEKTIEVKCDEQNYNILLLRYKELLSGGGGGTTVDDVPFEVDYTIIEKDTVRIDHEYLDSRFDKFLKLTSIKASKQEIENALNDLHKYFASLTEEQQKYANMVIHDLQNGDLVADSTKTFIDYINEYQANTENDRIHHLAIAFGLDETALRKLMNLKVTEHNLNEYGRFANLLASVDKKKAREWLEKKHGTKLKAFEIIQQTDALIRKFVLEGGFDIE